MKEEEKEEGIEGIEGRKKGKILDQGNKEGSGMIEEEKEEGIEGIEGIEGRKKGGKYQIKGIKREVE